MPTLAVTNFNIVCAVLGGFITLFGLVSYLFKERLFLSEALISLVAGVTFSPHATNWIQPLEYAGGSQTNLDSITHAFTRLVLGVQLVLAGVQLPSKYLFREWKSLALLLGPGMTGMWVISSLLVWAMVPNLPFLQALAVGACVTPTDPVLSNTIVKGKFADKNVPKSMQKIIIAESGANDGLGYPFLFLPLYLMKYVSEGGAGSTGGARVAIGLWFGETIGYQIILGTAYGAVVGWLAKELLHWAEERKYVDRESFLVFAITLALFIIGTCGMIGSDDVLACFVAGNAFTIDDWFRLETLDDSLQPTIDMLLNLSVFMWFGAVCPWESFGPTNDVIPTWRLVILGILILLLRRLPIIYAMHWKIRQIEDVRQALFMGFFGPIGVSAVFYLYVSLDFLDTITVNGVIRDDAQRLKTIMGVVIWFMAICSIVVHGLSVPVGKLGYHLPRTISSAIESRDDSDEPDLPFHIEEGISEAQAAASRLHQQYHENRGQNTQSRSSMPGSQHNLPGSPPQPRRRGQREPPPRMVFKIGGSVIPSAKKDEVTTETPRRSVGAREEREEAEDGKEVGAKQGREGGRVGGDGEDGEASGSGSASGSGDGGGNGGGRGDRSEEIEEGNGVEGRAVGDTATFSTPMHTA